MRSNTNRCIKCDKLIDAAIKTIITNHRNNGGEEEALMEHDTSNKNTSLKLDLCEALSAMTGKELPVLFKKFNRYHIDVLMGTVIASASHLYTINRILEDENRYAKSVSDALQNSRQGNFPWGSI